MDFAIPSGTLFRLALYVIISFSPSPYYFLISFNLGLMSHIKEPSINLCLTIGAENIISFYYFFKMEGKENANCIIKDKNLKKT